MSPKKSSPYTTGYEICLDNYCQPLAEHLPGMDNSAVIEIRICQS